VASSVDHRSKSEVNFKRTRRRCVSVRMSRSERLGNIVRTVLYVIRFIYGHPKQVRDGRSALKNSRNEPRGRLVVGYENGKSARVL
jgi:hypothetical protein